MRIEDRFAAQRRGGSPAAVDGDLDDVRRRAARLRSRRRGTVAGTVSALVIGIVAATILAGPTLTRSTNRRVVTAGGTSLPRPVPTWLPDGYTLTGARSAGTVHADRSRWTNVWSDATDAFALDGRSIGITARLTAPPRGGLWAATFPSGVADVPGLEKTTVGGRQALLRSAQGHRLRLIWNDGRATIEAVGAGMTRDGLLRVSASVRLRTSGGRLDGIDADPPAGLRLRWSGHAFVGGDEHDQNSSLTFKGEGATIGVGASVDRPDDGRLPAAFLAWQAGDGETVDVNGAAGVLTVESGGIVSVVWSPKPGVSACVSIVGSSDADAVRPQAVRIARSVRLVDEATWSGAIRAKGSHPNVP